MKSLVLDIPIRNHGFTNTSPFYSNEGGNPHGSCLPSRGSKRNSEENHDP